MGVSVSTVWRLGQPRSGWWLAVCPGDDFALSGSDCVTFSMRSRHSALSIQSMASHWIPSLWRQTPTQTDTPCIHKHQQPGRHNGSIIQCEHVMKWAMSRLLAYCTRKQLAAGESEAFPNVWQFAGMITKRLNPHPHLCLRCLLFPLYASMYDVKLCKRFLTCCTPAAPGRRCAYWSTLGVSRLRSWYWIVQTGSPTQWKNMLSVYSPRFKSNKSTHSPATLFS